MRVIAKMGKRGTLVLPAKIRRRLGLEEGTLVLVEETEEGVSIRPAVAVPVEIYPAERRAALLLENAVDEEDYARACNEVRQLGLDPEEIPHERP